MVTIRFRGMDLSDDIVVGLDGWIPNDEYNPHRVSPWVICNRDTPIAIVFASNEQDAFDEAVDNNKLDAFVIPDNEHDWYACSNGDCEAWHAGNAGEPIDATELSLRLLPNPTRLGFIAALRDHLKAIA